MGLIFETFIFIVGLLLVMSFETEDNTRIDKCYVEKNCSQRFK